MGSSMARTAAGNGSSFAKKFRHSAQQDGIRKRSGVDAYAARVASTSTSSTTSPRVKRCKSCLGLLQAHALRGRTVRYAGACGVALLTRDAVDAVDAFEL